MGLLEGFQVGAAIRARRQEVDFRRRELAMREQAAARQQAEYERGVGLRAGIPADEALVRKALEEGRTTAIPQDPTEYYAPGRVTIPGSPTVSPEGGGEEAENLGLTGAMPPVPTEGVYQPPRSMRQPWQSELELRRERPDVAQARLRLAEAGRTGPEAALPTVEQARAQAEVTERKARAKETWPNLAEALTKAEREPDPVARTAGLNAVWAGVLRAFADLSPETFPRDLLHLAPTLKTGAEAEAQARAVEKVTPFLKKVLAGEPLSTGEQMDLMEEFIRHPDAPQFTAVGKHLLPSMFRAAGPAAKYVQGFFAAYYQDPSQGALKAWQGVIASALAAGDGRYIEQIMTPEGQITSQGLPGLGMTPKLVEEAMAHEKERETAKAKQKGTLEAQAEMGGRPMKPEQIQRSLSLAMKELDTAQHTPGEDQAARIAEAQRNVTFWRDQLARAEGAAAPPTVPSQRPWAKLSRTEQLVRRQRAIARVMGPDWTKANGDGAWAALSTAQKQKVVDELRRQDEALAAP